MKTRPLQQRAAVRPAGSRGQTKAAEVGQAARPTLTQPDLMDAQRAAFIRALDSADFDLPEWESEFTGSMFERLERKLPFTDKMRVQIDRLMNRYRNRVTWESGAASSGAALKPVRSEMRVAWVPSDLDKLTNGR